MDMGADRDVLAEQVEGLRAVDNPSSWRASGGEPDEHDAGVGAPDVVAKVVADTAAGAHPGPSDDDGTADDLVDGHRFGCVAHEMQAGHLERIFSPVKECGEFGAEAFRMAFEDLVGGN